MIGGSALLGTAAISALSPAHATNVPPVNMVPNSTDLEILLVAQIAEALAVTTYHQIIAQAPFFTRLPDADPLYLRNAVNEEMSHYYLEKSITGKDTPYTSFYYPHQMFKSPQVTLNVLVSLEDAFIAAYLLGVRYFSTADLRVTSARIMGIESDHRTLARDIGLDVDPIDGGPLTAITGLQGVSEPCVPPNNNGYERTLGWTSLDQAVAALTPFFSKSAADAAGWNTANAYPFQPFGPVLPNKLGEYMPAPVGA